MDQNQTPQPDYSFITNQGSPTGPLPNQPKKRDKKVIVLIVLLVVTTVVVGLAIFLPEKQQEQQQESPEVVVENNEPRTNQEATVRQYLTSIASGQYGEAYQKLAPGVIMGDEANVTQDWFTLTYIPSTTQTWSFSPCTIYTPDELNPNTVQSLCLSTDGSLTIVREYQMVENNGVITIQSTKALGVREL